MRRRKKLIYYDIDDLGFEENETISNMTYEYEEKTSIEETDEEYDSDKTTNEPRKSVHGLVGMVVY